nr:porin family protein [uncultured Moellerella sp.]
MSVFQAVNQKNWSAMDDYANTIEFNFGKNHSLYYFIKGMLAVKDNNYIEAINLFNQAIILQPDFLRVKLELTKIYLINNNKQQAKRIANELLADEKLPITVKQRLSSLFANQSRKKNLSGHIHIGYQYQDNINKSSDGKTQCDKRDLQSQKCLNEWRAPKQYPAHGLLLYSELTHQKMINPNHYWLNQLFASQKQYFDHQEYNETSLTLYSYYQYRHSQYQLHFGPRGYYNNDGAGAQYYGIGLKWDAYWQPTFLNQWTLMAGQEIKYQQHPTRRYSDGSHSYHRFIISRTIPIGTFYQLTQYSRHQHRDISKDYHQLELLAGIRWQGFTYFEPDIAFHWDRDQFQYTNAILRAQRRDTTLGTRLKIKTKNWQLMGFTPIFTFSHQRIVSNVNWLYSHRRNEVQIYFERHF